MPQVIGPTIPRWQLGARLRALRVDADLTIDEIRAELGCSESKVHKIEAGDVRLSRADLTIMLQTYKVTDDEAKESLYELQRLGQQRAWWAPYAGGSLPGEFQTFLDLEGVATSIHGYEPLVIYGLLQTEEYARANAETASGPLTPQQVERQVQIRLQRQANFFEGVPKKLWVVLDEAALRRPIGGPDVMRRQLQHLLELPAHQVTLQVVPFSAGGYPGTVGPFAIFEFQDDLHSPVVYTEGQSGLTYQERAKEVERATMMYSHVTASALSVPDTKALIAGATRSM